MSRRPNLLLFIMDDQTPNTIRTLGNPHIHTPHLDVLAERGVFFRPYTTVPVCTPGRAELLTGRTALRNGCDWFGRPIDGSLTLLPQAMNAAGYHCCHIGKWHNDGHPRDRGYHETHFVFPGDLATPYTGHTFTYHDGDELVTGHSTELICGRAMEFVERAPADQPWFCYVALHSPHDPRVCPEPWMSMYDRMLPPLPANYMPEHPFDNGDMMIRDERLAGSPRRQQEIVRHRADYYAMISHHDHWIGRVLATLQQRGMTDDTVVVFTSDHGLACGCHGLMGKENLYEHSARVPLILAGPGIPQGERHDNDCLCGHYDFLPTLMNLLDLPVPATAEGISYHDVVLGQRDTMRETICAAYRQCMRLARDCRYKLLYYPHLDRTQLFDLVADPDETNDLLASWRRDAEGRCCPPPATPNAPQPPADPKPCSSTFNNPLYSPPISRAEADAIVRRLRQALLQWQQENQDPIYEWCKKRWAEAE